MRKIKTKQKIQTIAALALLVFVFLPINFAEAIQATPQAISSVTSIAKTSGAAALKTAAWGLVIYGILEFLGITLWWFVTMAYTFLNIAVNTALNPGWFQMPIVMKAWELVRDFVNIWFILLLLIIAIGTILRVSSFQLKRLLPMLIIIALVVNFSLPITGFVIDISNVIANQFLKAT